MDFDVPHKENTYKYKKARKACSQCFKETLSCPKCQGPCILSRAYLKQLNQSKKLRDQLKDKYYAQIIDTLRVSLHKHAEQEGDEEYLDNEADYDANELLERFHENPEAHDEIARIHATEYHPNITTTDQKKNFETFAGRHTVVEGLCRSHRNFDSSGKEFDKPVTRLTKKQNLMI